MGSYFGEWRGVGVPTCLREGDGCGGFTYFGWCCCWMCENWKRRSLRLGSFGISYSGVVRVYITSYACR